MSLASPLFTSGTYTVTRRATGSLANGDWTPGASSTFTVEADLQPLSGNDLKILPEGQHGEEMQKLYLSVELFTARLDKEADQITIDGAEWKVINVRKYTILTGNFKVIVARIDQPS